MRITLSTRNIENPCNLRNPALKYQRSKASAHLPLNGFTQIVLQYPERFTLLQEQEFQQPVPEFL